jgi:SecD/SecF fusion protein
MDKPKKWQLALIIAVILLTFYNIFPTLFYYSKPLKEPVSQNQAKEISQDIATRVNSLEEFSQQWLNSFCSHLGLKTTNIETTSSQLVKVEFSTEKDCILFKNFLPEAGVRVPFVPAQLSLTSLSKNDQPNIAYVKRNTAFNFSEGSVENIFSYVPQKVDGSLAKNPEYQSMVYDRIANLVDLTTSNNHIQESLSSFLTAPKESQQEASLDFCSQLNAFIEVFGESSLATQRFITSLSIPLNYSNSQAIGILNTLEQEFSGQKQEILKEQKVLEQEGSVLNESKQDLLKELTYKNNLISVGIKFFNKNAEQINIKTSPLKAWEVKKSLQDESLDSPTSSKQSTSLQNLHPFFASVDLDWIQGKVYLQLHEDVKNILDITPDASEQSHFYKEKTQQFIYNDIALLSQSANEQILPLQQQGFQFNIHQSSDTSSYLVLNLEALAKEKIISLKRHILTEWHPQHPDLQRDIFPILDEASYNELPKEDQLLGLMLYAPATEEKVPSGLKTSSIYIFAKGLRNILHKYDSNQETEEGKLFKEDLESLERLLRQEGFFSYPGHFFNLPKSLHDDYVFELDSYYQNVLKASREDFQVKGSKRFAFLELSNLEQRLLTNNKIKDEEQSELLRWRDDYHTASSSLDYLQRYLVPPPFKNPFWTNFKTSCYKYFHGDVDKVIRWGLDLAGGKSVRIGLKNQNNKAVTTQEDLEEGVNELTKRVNKMGVSEVEVLIEGKSITVNFPGSQNFSAEELIKSSSMTFHVVNEKFSPNASIRNNELKNFSNKFLQEVWNEAVVTNRKSPEDIQRIARHHLGGEVDGQYIPHRSQEAKKIYEDGLRLANPEDKSSATFDDSLCKIVKLRGDDLSKWQNLSHPLMIVFNNFALEGSNLENIHSEYNPSQGNVLVFTVKDSYEKGKAGSPRDEVYNWTYPFAKENISNTPKGELSNNNGWRMAILLNGSVITNPNLFQPLMVNSQITGNFSQREVQKLAADLKAGSLSYTPTILTERNISPELGKAERSQGITAALIGLILVATCMIWYYRFAGCIATIAVIFNLLITWGVLQNLGAALTLPGIAGIVLTIGMAVDANVLVFERIREEFALSGKIAQSIKTGYRKAFSAIVDSNITTIIAAIILIQFDAGPVKAFAITLIIGISSSMFTALFMTKHFFAHWARNPSNKSLKMLNLIQSTNFDFIKIGKVVTVISLVIILIGSGLLYKNRMTIFGMDFTGGYSLVLDLKEIPDTNYRDAVTQAFLKGGAQEQDFQIRELNAPNILKLQFGTSMDQPDHPFENFNQESTPRLTWVVDALKDQQLGLRNDSIKDLENNWVNVSGQISNTMKYNAIWGLSLALLSILIYISIRFELRFALSSIICLLHDILITIACLAIFHSFNVPLQIDLEIIGALMTIVGYSLNDIIIIFDRIREDLRLHRKFSLLQITNQAVNKTLSRTLMTSITTLLVLVSLTIFGGGSVFAFSFVMLLGILLGTISSLFVAPLILTMLEKKTASSN